MDRISYLLDRYLENACTRKEMDELLDYVKQNPEDPNLRDALQRSWDTENPGEAAWIPTQKSLSELTAIEKATSQRFPWKVAACIGLLAACLAGFLFLREDVDGTLAENQPLHKKSVKTITDERRLVVLSDGSKIWVNNLSKITYEPSFNERTREVELDGEAFFDIRPDPLRPFIIKTGKVTTTVLGTAFNIRAFPGENVVTVTVARGKVRVDAGNEKPETITANQQITLKLEPEKLEEPAVDVVDASEVANWIKSDLILQEVTLGEVEEILEQRYSVDIRFDNERLKKCRFTSTFFHNASLDEVITAICLVNKASYKVNDNIITIYGNGCDEKDFSPINN